VRRRLATGGAPPGDRCRTRGDWESLAPGGSVVSVRR